MYKSKEPPEESIASLAADKQSRQVMQNLQKAHSAMLIISPKSGSASEASRMAKDALGVKKVSEGGTITLAKLRMQAEEMFGKQAAKDVSKEVPELAFEASAGNEKDEGKAESKFSTAYEPEKTNLKGAGSVYGCYNFDEKTYVYAGGYTELEPLGTTRKGMPREFGASPIAGVGRDEEAELGPVKLKLGVSGEYQFDADSTKTRTLRTDISARLDSIPVKVFGRGESTSGTSAGEKFSGRSAAGGLAVENEQGGIYAFVKKESETGTSTATIYALTVKFNF